jgi:hypothetical protein
MGALFEEAGVVDLPGLDRLARRQCFEGVSRGAEPHFVIAPGRVCNEVLQLLMDRAHLLDIGAAARCDRLDALALGIAQEPQRIGREGGSPAVVPENLADPAEELCQSALPTLECLHDQ